MGISTANPELSENAGEIKPCMACLAPNDIDAEFCRECGMRFDDADVLQPLNIVRAEGQVYQNLALGGGTRRPRFVVVVGVWIIFLPMLLVSIALVIEQILDLHGFQSFIFICAGSGFAYFSLLMLGRVTRRYLKPDDEASTSTELPPN